MKMVDFKLSQKVPEMMESKRHYDSLYRYHDTKGEILIDW